MTVPLFQINATNLSALLPSGDGTNGGSVVGVGNQEVETSPSAFGIIGLQLRPEGVSGRFALRVDVVSHSSQLDLKIPRDYL